MSRDQELAPYLDPVRESNKEDFSSVDGIFYKINALLISKLIED